MNTRYYHPDQTTITGLVNSNYMDTAVVIHTQSDVKKTNRKERRKIEALNRRCK